MLKLTYCSKMFDHVSDMFVIGMLIIGEGVIDMCITDMCAFTFVIYV